MDKNVAGAPTEVYAVVVAEEEYDEYDDLYNDVNVGENFMRKNQTEVTEESGAAGLRNEMDSSRVTGGVESNNGNEGFRGNGSSDVNNVGVGGFRVELEQSSRELADTELRLGVNSVQNDPHGYQQGQLQTANVGSGENVIRVGTVNGNGGNAFGDQVGGGGGGGGGGTILFVGDLQWWTTDAELESEICKYGAVKEVRFFDERASGKSKGYCQVEFYDPQVATACKEGMNGHLFNGRPCLVAYASPYTVKRMGEAQMNRNQPQMGQAAAAQPQRGPQDVPNERGNHQPGGENNGRGFDNSGRGFGNSGRGFGRGNWGRGYSQGGMGNRGRMGSMRGRAGRMGMHGMTGNGNGFGQGMGGTPPMMHPQAMMGQGFDPTFGGPMGRLGSYGGFPGGPVAPFSGGFPSYGPMGNLGLPSVAPHVNPAFFGRGMHVNGMGMMPNPGVDGHNMGMWSNPNVGGWAGDEHGGRAGESSYGEEAGSDHQFGEGSQERGPRPNSTKDKDRASEREWSESAERRHRDDGGSGYEGDAPKEDEMGRDHDFSERRHRDDRDVGRERERGRERGHERSLDHERERDPHRDDRDKYTDPRRYKNREAEYDDEWDRGRLSRTRSKSRTTHEEDQRLRSRSRSKDTDYGKRRRGTSK